MTAHTGPISGSRSSADARLIWSFALRDLKARFTATALGLLWTLIVPIATVIIYSIVFSVIFRAQAPPMGNGKSLFAAWFFCGLVTWNIFSLISGTAMNSILNMGSMMQKVFIPSYVPVISAGVSIGIERLLEAGVMLLLMLILLNIGWTWLFYPLIIALVAIFAISLGYILAIALVHFRDTGQIYAIVSQMWFFLTPIMYPIDLIPVDFHGIPLQDLFKLNPMTSFVTISRDLVYSLQLPSAASVAYAVAWTLVMLLAARLVYAKWGRDVSEAI